MNSNDLLKEILAEQKKQTNLLQTITSSLEQEKIRKEKIRKQNWHI